MIYVAGWLGEYTYVREINNCDEGNCSRLPNI